MTDQGSDPGYLGTLSPGEHVCIPLLYVSERDRAVSIIHVRPAMGAVPPDSMAVDDRPRVFEWGVALPGSADRCIDTSSLIPGGILALKCARLPAPLRAQGDTTGARTPNQHQGGPGDGVQGDATAVKDPPGHVYMSVLCRDRIHRLRSESGLRNALTWDIVVSPPIVLSSMLPMPSRVTLLGDGFSSDSAIAQVDVAPGSEVPVCSMDPTLHARAVVEPEGYRFVGGSPVAVPTIAVVKHEKAGSLAVAVSPLVSPNSRFEIGLDWQAGGGDEGDKPRGKRKKKGAQGPVRFRPLRMTLWAPLLVRNPVGLPVQAAVVAWPRKKPGEAAEGPERDAEGGGGAALPVRSLATDPHPEGIRSVHNADAVVPPDRAGLMSFPVGPQFDFGVVVRVPGSAWSPVVDPREGATQILRLMTTPDSGISGSVDLIASVREGWGASKLAYELHLLPSVEIVNRLGIPLAFRVLARRDRSGRPVSDRATPSAIVPAISGSAGASARPVPLLWSVASEDNAGLTLSARFGDAPSGGGGAGDWSRPIDVLDMLESSAVMRDVPLPVASLRRSLTVRGREK